jgi:hypothetical protein
LKQIFDLDHNQLLKFLNELSIKMSTPASVFELAKSLSTQDQWTLLEDLLAHLKGSAPKKASKVAKDPSAPKKPMSPYIELVNKVVWPVLKELSESSDLDDDEKKALRSVTARTQVASSLWAKSKDIAVSKDAILAAYEAWKANGPAPKSPKASPKAKAEPKPKAAAKPKAVPKKIAKSKDE